MSKFNSIFIICFAALLKKNEANNCFEYTKNIYIHHPTESYQSPDPLGKWVSSRYGCF